MGWSLRLEGLRNTTPILNINIRSGSRDLSLDFTNTNQEYHTLSPIRLTSRQCLTVCVTAVSESRAAQLYIRHQRSWYSDQPWTGRSGFQSRQVQEIFFLHRKKSTTVLRPNNRTFLSFKHLGPPLAPCFLLSAAQLEWLCNRPTNTGRRGRKSTITSPKRLLSGQFISICINRMTTRLKGNVGKL